MNETCKSARDRDESSLRAVINYSAWTPRDMLSLEFSSTKKQLGQKAQRPNISAKAMTAKSGSEMHQISEARRLFQC